jgi:hypothetical protein
MTLGKQKRRWIRATLLTSLLASASVASADFTEPLNRFGRTFGVGWGDGYHACKSSGICLPADLPPQSYAARQKHAASLGVHQHGSTFYDQFDASSGRACDSCDSAPAMTDIHGSQVTYGAPEVGPREAIADNGQPTFAPTPAMPIQPPTVLNREDVPTALNPPLTEKRHAIGSSPKVYPTRPSMAPAPSLRDLAPRTPARSVASGQFANGFGFRSTTPAETRLATPSRTPNAITPVHTQERRSTSPTSSHERRQGSASNSLKNMGDAEQAMEGTASRAATDPRPTGLRFPTLVPPKRAINPVVTGSTTAAPVQPTFQMPMDLKNGQPATAAPNGQSHPVSDIPRSTGRPNTSNRSTKPRRSEANPGQLGTSPDLQSVQLIPKSSVGVASNRLPKRSVSFIQYPPPEPAATTVSTQRAARPQRSTFLPPSMRGNSTYGVTPVFSDSRSMTAAIQKPASKPSRLGARTMPVAVPGAVLSTRVNAGGSVRANPYAARPVLELAERAGVLDSNVIRQPDIQR